MDLSRKALVAWMKHFQSRSSLNRIENHARMADRFLDWMKKDGHLSCNPFQELRSQYGRYSGRIVRALLSDEPRAALEKLRPSPVFASALGPQMRQRVDLMRSLGYRYKHAEGQLRRFDSFLQGRPDLLGKSVPQLSEAWRQAGTGLHHAHEAQQCGRMLSKAQARLDPATAIIPTNPKLWRQMLASHRRPYIYTEEQVAQLLETARHLPYRLSPLRPLTAYTMLLLTYSAGLRIQEVANLNLGDVDLTDKTIEIRSSKFFKSRRLPLPPGVFKELRHYLEERRKAGAPIDPNEGLFWHTMRRQRYAKISVWNLLIHVLRQPPIKRSRRPRRNK
jgi:hypothetical protein